MSEGVSEGGSEGGRDKMSEGVSERERERERGRERERKRETEREREKVKVIQFNEVPFTVPHRALVYGELSRNVGAPVPLPCCVYQLLHSGVLTNVLGSLASKSSSIF